MNSQQSSALETSLEISNEEYWERRCDDLIKENVRLYWVSKEHQHESRQSKEEATSLQNRVRFLERERDHEKERSLAIGRYGAEVMLENSKLAARLEELQAESAGSWLVAHANAQFRTKKWRCRKQIGEADGKYGWRPLGSTGYFRDLEDVDQYRCPVCRERYEDGEKTMLLPCKHRFHEDCVSEWFQKNISCPRCTRKFQLKAQLTLFEAKQEETKGHDTLTSETDRGDDARTRPTT